MASPIRVIIDGVTAEAKPAETVLTAARRLGVEIPTLCHMEGRPPNESCGVCMVEIDGSGNLVPACATRVFDGMKVHTNTATVRKVRKLALELLLSDHLGDCLAPCERACPAAIDIPGFIRLSRKGKHQESIALIKERVAFPGVLGRICPRFCEKVCRRKDLDEPVSILSLKRFAADRDLESDQPHVPQKKPSSGKRVAIVGAGIAGLTAAYYLLQEGHDCTLFDGQSKPGGGMCLIPEFRLPHRIVEGEVATIRALGAHFEMNSALGTQVTLDFLRQDYDAVLLAIGRQRERAYSVPGSNVATSTTALLQQVAGGAAPRPVATAVVIGSDHTVVDACRTLLRLGAKNVKLVPDRAIESGLAFRDQIEAARSEGIEILAKAEPRKIEKLPGSGFRIAVRQGEKNVTLQVEQVFAASEPEPDLELVRDQGLETTERGIKVDHHTLATSIEGVFAAGSIAGLGRFAVVASASGRRAAESICRYLANERAKEKDLINVRIHHLSEKDLEQFFRDFQEAPRQIAEHVGPDEARKTFREVDGGFSESAAASEAARCLQCACAKKDSCELRNCASEYQANPNKYGGMQQPFEREITHEDAVYESAKCIKCGRCISIAEEAKEPLGLTYIGRGFHVKVGVPFGETLRVGLRKVAHRCIAACPTGALAQREKD